MLKDTCGIWYQQVPLLTYEDNKLSNTYRLIVRIVDQMMVIRYLFGVRVEHDDGFSFKDVLLSTCN